jgi:hypothetical protein
MWTKKQAGEKRNTVGTQRYAGCLLKNMLSTKNSSILRISDWENYFYSASSLKQQSADNGSGFLLRMVINNDATFTWWKTKYVIIPFLLLLGQANHTGGIMVSVLASSAVDRGFQPRSGQTKDYKIGICCFSAKHAITYLVFHQVNVASLFITILRRKPLPLSKYFMSGQARVHLP